ncbi:DUF6446 family protein [Falsirhodobacter xinxiangensis]|uniref:DUF6446 family protein n=1 Tax=Falsirhodobacter xinxiangensis TaxID=2530049 RepID=UPI0010AA5B70|nr:DUF6446 family protein [Rhodobacter xinxiangensis]
MGRIAVIAILVAALLMGAGLWYSQTRGYYHPVELTALEITGPDGAVQSLPVEGIEGIDAESSPIRFRACARVVGPVPTGVPFANPTPLTAPGWFDCFDANAIGEALERGEATAFLSRANVHSGADRVLAVFPDGRVFAWNQLRPAAE